MSEPGSMNTPGMTLCARRAEELASLFREIEQTRMAGVPVLNRALRVEAIGFELFDEPIAPQAFGILLTPWFMNLVLLPLTRIDAVPPPDTRQIRRIGSTRFEFITSHEPATGAFDACSLFSPVFEFPDQASAVATARAVLMSLRARPAAIDAPPARRAFFRALASGRSAPAA